jgi:tetratricopeptide (TPR) repeat protein
LSEDEKKAIEQVKTTNVEAYEVYLRGRQYFHQLRRRSLEFALQMFERAIELDPGYALAYAGLADCCSFLYQYFYATQALLDKGETASKRALELAPELAEAHASRGLAVALSNRFDEAEEEFKTALRLDPRSFEAAYFYARACHAKGKAEEAVKWYERAVEVRPDDFAVLSLLAAELNALGRRDDATRVFRLAYGASRKHLELNPDNPRALYMGAGALSHLGEHEKSREWNRRALAMEPDDAGVLYNIACGFALEHQPEEALTALNQAIDKGFGHWKWIEHDSDFDSIRNQPGFLKILARRPVEDKP